MPGKYACFLIYGGQYKKNEKEFTGGKLRAAGALLGMMPAKEGHPTFSMLSEKRHAIGIGQRIESVCTGK